MATFSKDVPLVSATKFNVPPQAIDDGAGAYGTVVHASTNAWVLGSTLLGRRLKVIVSTGALTSTPTGLKVGLYEDDNDDGSSATLVTGTDTEFATPPANKSYEVEISLAGVVATTYYSLGLSSNGGGSTSIIAGAVAVFLDPDFKS